MQLLALPIERPARSLWMAESLAFLSDLNPLSALRTRVEVELGPLTYALWYPASQNTVATFIGRNASSGIILCGGAVNSALATGLWDGYLARQLGNTIPVVNEWTKDRAAGLLGQIQSLGGPWPFKWFLAGHSAGGAILTTLAARRDTTPGMTARDIVTFGSPRAFGTQSANSMLNVPTVRVMNHDDWVPLLPPHVGLGSSIGWAVGSNSRQRFLTFCHTSGGLQLNANGTTNQRLIPDGAQLPSGISIIASIVASYGTNLPFVSHTIENYIDRLKLLVGVDPLRNYAGGGADEDVVPVTPSQIRAEENRTSSAIFHTGAVQNSTPLNIPTDRAFKAFRLGRVWYVRFGDLQIVCAPNRKRAQALAAAGNNFLRRLQRQAIVDPATLAQQMTTYLQLAADPSSGFSPTLNTNIPG